MPKEQHRTPVEIYAAFYGCTLQEAHNVLARTWREAGLSPGHIAACLRAVPGTNVRAKKDVRSPEHEPLHSRPLERIRPPDTRRETFCKNLLHTGAHTDSPNLVRPTPWVVSC
ncbi:MAG: hypothetical protein OJF50_006409 [Nitrospira sp.]|nr:hypothetical protein [Nitrospira sp.]